MSRRRRKPSVARRLLITLLLFLAVMTILVTVALLRPTEQSTQQPQQNTQTDPSSTESVSNDTQQGNETTDRTFSAEILRALAADRFANLDVSAKYITVYDTTADIMLYEKNAEEQITAASTIKLLTALTMLDYVTEDTIFTVGDEINLIGANSSTAKLKKGYTLTTEQILDVLLIPSGNDAAYVIAAHVGRKLAKDPEIGNRDAVNLFLEKMNEKAKLLGATNSLFTCPDGYPNKTQYTTASDMLKIAVAAAENEAIRKTTSKVYVKYTMNNGDIREYTNTNQLIVPSSANHYEGLFGLKTGTTNAAGECLIAGYSIHGHEIIMTVFKSASTKRYPDCQAIIDVVTDIFVTAKEYSAQ